VAQLTLYLPDDVAARLRRDARKAKKSLSAFVAERLGSEASHESRRAEKLRELFGTCDLPDVVDDAPLDEIDGL
jgi:hypothetical protein